jgi:hypothetical protein
MSSSFSGLSPGALYASTLIFGLAILHVLCASWFAKRAALAPRNSLKKKILHFLSEVEIVFAFWAVIFISGLALFQSPTDAIRYLRTGRYAEPIFVFAIITFCATRPVLSVVERVLGRFKSDVHAFLAIFILGPLVGSFITEPAAMTVCALLLLPRFYLRTMNIDFRYAMTALLFVNVSIGGTLTSFAAPPVLMVAGVWNWNSAEMFLNFGWKAVLACFLSTAITAYLFRREFAKLTHGTSPVFVCASPLWLSALHVGFVALLIFQIHQPAAMMTTVLVFVVVTKMTAGYQDGLKLKAGFFVALFLTGLVVLGGPQGWWLEPVLTKLQRLPLFLGAMGLTAVVDNAALTYLGTLIPSLGEGSKYALVAGAVVGGGLTIIANAPNPAGYGILNDAQVFGADGFSAWRLFKSALVPTVVAALCFWFL